MDLTRARTIKQLSDEHGVAVATLNLRAESRGIAGTKLGNARVFTPTEQRKLLKEGKRGRPRKVRR